MLSFLSSSAGVLWAIGFFLAASMVPVGCNGPATRELVLNDFETDSDLDRIHWQCRTLFSLSREYATSGQQSLKMELFPAAYPGLSLKLNEHDWSRYAVLALDIYSLQDQSLEITARIDDRPDYPDYEDRYNERQTLLSGNNHIRIPLSSLRTSGSGRPLNLKTIRRFMLFLVHPHEVHSFYVDNIKLES